MFEYDIIIAMIYFATDHQGFALKEKLKEFVGGLGYEMKDFGAFEEDPEDDYPNFIRSAAEAVSKNPIQDRAIILGGSGQGEAIAANRFRGVRAAVFYGGPMDIIKLSREHNDANILSLGAAFLDEATAKEAVQLWLGTPFSGEERHMRRIHEIDGI